jgi:chitinase
MATLSNDKVKVWKKSCLMILIFTSAILLAAMPALAQHRVVAYYPGWTRSKLPANRVKFEYLTHINHAFAWPLANGSITGYGEINHPELIAETHKAGKKILISLGGWGQSAGFAPMAADSTIRKKFINNLVDYCKTRGYDGADFDWEFPQNAVERANLTTLIKETYQAFNALNPPLLLTMVAVASDYSGQWHDYAALARYVDWFNLMAYDFHGSWTDHAGHNAPLYAPVTDYDGSAHQGIQYLRDQRGIPKEKIHLGMPFYGKECSASQLYGPAASWSDLEYSAVVPRLESGWDYFWDDVSKVPYLLNASRIRFVTFDDSLSLSGKCEYAKANGLGGVMIWALGQDVVGSEQPLLEAVGRAMLQTTQVASEKPAVAKNFVLFDNYPNPFNPTTTIMFQLEREMPVNLSIYSLTGDLVTVLKNGMASTGKNTIVWDATNYSSGVYFYKFETAGFSETKKMILAR